MIDWKNKKIKEHLNIDGTDIITFDDGETVAVKTQYAERKETLCNLCGLTCNLSDEPHYIDRGGLIEEIIRGGYLSTAGNGNGALDDCTFYEFSLCEFCLDWLFAKFKIPVKTGDYDLDDHQEWRPAFQRVMEDSWRTLKEQFFEEYNKRNKARSEK